MKYLKKFFCVASIPLLLLMLIGIGDTKVSEKDGFKIDPSRPQIWHVLELSFGFDPFGAIGGLFSGILGYSASKSDQKNQAAMNERNLWYQDQWNDQNIRFQGEQNDKQRSLEQYMNSQNINMTRETNAQNEALMREGWGREDTEVQRRTADLKAAGINPILAAGGGAASGAPVRMESPQNNMPSELTAPHGEPGHENSLPAMAPTVVALLSQSMDWARTGEQLKLMRAQNTQQNMQNELDKATFEDRIAMQKAMLGRLTTQNLMGILEKDEAARRYTHYASNNIYPDIHNPISSIVDGVKGVISDLQGYRPTMPWSGKKMPWEDVKAPWEGLSERLEEEKKTGHKTTTKGQDFLITLLRQFIGRR